MTNGLVTMDRGVMDDERTRRLLDDYKPRSSQTYDERIRPEDVDKIAAEIKADSSLTFEEREALLHELTLRYERTAKLSTHSHMGD